MSDVVVSQNENVLVLTLSRPHKKNALTRQMYLELANAIHYAEHDPQIKVILIEGDDGCFTAGNDMHDFIAAVEKDAEEVPETEQFMRALLQCKIPVVAKVEGLAIGIGTTLLLHCDFVYASPSARFMMPFINLGLVPEYAASFILPKLVGHVKAAELLMLGESFSAEDAQQMGLINAVLEPNELNKKIEQVTHSLTKKPRQALLQTKSLLKHDQQHVTEHIYKELEYFVAAMRSEAATEAFTAFLEKRAPDEQKFQ